jgi:hypothetical protein
MTEEGMLSIVRRETTYQVRYASSNPHGLEWPPYPCSDEGTLVALLHQCGTDPWSIQQAGIELRKGRTGVLPLRCTQAQLQASFSSNRAGAQPRVSAAAA